MIIRKIRQERMRRKKKLILGVIGILLVGGALFLLLQRHQNKPQEIEQPKQEKQDPIIAIGQSISLSGTIKTENHFPLYTHSISTEKEKTYGLKSTSLNLNNHLQQSIEIEGTIEKIENNLPIVQVQKIKKTKQNMILWKNTYLFTDSLLFLDFSEQPELSADHISGNFIEINYADVPLVSIEYFPCSKVTDAQNCEELLLDYKYSDKENFTSYLGYTFYRYGEKDRISFNANILGYIFRVESDEDILNVSHMVDFIDQDFIESKKQQDIQKTCTEALTGTTITNIENTAIKHIPPTNIMITTKLTTREGQEILCTNNINLWDQMNIEKTNIIE